MFRHGGNIFYVSNKVGLKFSDITDLSSNTTEAFWLKKYNIRSLADKLPNEYPLELEKRIAQMFNLKEENLVVNAGTSQLIKDLCLLFMNRTASIISPAYTEYEYFSKIFNISASHILLEENNNFSFRWHDNFESDIVFICNPNNPTGQLIEKNRLIKIIGKNEKSLFVIDESYMDFCFNKESLVGNELGNVAVLRSFSKLHGLAGLRVGWLYSANLKLIYNLKRLVVPWAVTRIAELLAIQALSVDFKKTIDEVKFLRDWLTLKINDMGDFEIFPSYTNFVLIKSLNKDAVLLKDCLLKHGVLIRTCEDFVGLNDKFFRISLKSKHSLKVFLTALENCR